MGLIFLSCVTTVTVYNAQCAFVSWVNRLGDSMYRYLVIVSHPDWLPEAEETSFFNIILAERLIESAEKAGFNTELRVFNDVKA